MQTIYSGAGQQDVEVYAQDDLGRIAIPTGATCKIVDLLVSEDADDSVRVVSDTTGATIDPVSTTTTAYAGPSAADIRRVTVASAAGIVAGRTYKLTEGGSVEAITIDRIDGLDLYLRDDLRFAFSIGATLEGARVTASFPASWADDEAQLDRRAFFGCDWIFMGVAGPLQVRTLATIERRGRAARATVADVLAIDDQIASATHTKVNLERKVQQADRELSAYMIHRNQVPSDMIDGELGRLAVAYRALELAYRVLPNEFIDRADWAAGEAKRWRQMLTSGHKPSDTVEVQRSVDRVRPTRRSIGVSMIRGAE